VGIAGGASENNTYLRFTLTSHQQAFSKQRNVIGLWRGAHQQWRRRHLAAAYGVKKAAAATMACENDKA